MTFVRVVIKGAGDLASGIACRLFRSGFSVIMTEVDTPTTVRRTVAFSPAVYEGESSVEGVCAKLAQKPCDIEGILEAGKIAVVVDPQCKFMRDYRPNIIVDAILAKKNLGTSIEDAGVVIGVGPGFEAGKDCHYVIETKRGHYLGSVLEHGCAIPNTGIPGEIGGYSIERLIKAEADGIFYPEVSIGTMVKKGQIVARSGDVPVKAKMDGIVRGILQQDVQVHKGMKCGDIDARYDLDYCYTVSDKARAVGGGVLEGIFRKINHR